MGGIEDLIVFRKAFKLAMKIFEVSKSFPRYEAFALTGQIRRSSRSVCANLAEAYRKRRYEAHFVSKISDCDMENTETQVWLKFAKECAYIDKELFTILHNESIEIGKILDFMMKNPQKFKRKT